LICAAPFVLQLDFSIVNVALPSIQQHLEVPAAQLQWLVTGYALTFGSVLLVGGRAADLLGRRRLLRIGLSLFAVASLAAGLAGSSLELIIARVMQGAGGAMVSPAALSLLTTMNAEGPARTRALAIWQAGTAAGATTGIIAGGLLTPVSGLASDLPRKPAVGRRDAPARATPVTVWRPDRRRADRRARGDPLDECSGGADLRPQ
jgi:MFS family permease